MASSATINKIERAHQMYREGKYVEALRFYTLMLSMAKTKSQKIASPQQSLLVSSNFTISKGDFKVSDSTVPYANGNCLLGKSLSCLIPEAEAELEEDEDEDDDLKTTEVGGIFKIGSSEQQSSSWEAIPQPKGHSRLDYSRWDRVEEESSEDDDDDDDDDAQPQYRFRVKTIGVRAVK
ncbi:hypothetical protein HAX54_001356 [Datura stramonium]|uniref:Uncharacterized protein n=1 Tax=Datura stramonium TaxID=4076 RepID=A0ABS8T4G0_DATST|nr:hypothetical protein [Datura stramonium]